MMTYKQEKETFIIYMIVILILLGISSIIGGFLWPYTINSWLLFFNKEASIVFWQGCLLGLAPFIGQASIPAAIITWILMLFIS